MAERLFFKINAIGQTYRWTLGSEDPMYAFVVDMEKSDFLKAINCFFQARARRPVASNPYVSIRTIEGDSVEIVIRRSTGQLSEGQNRVGEKKMTVKIKGQYGFVLSRAGFEHLVDDYIRRLI